MKLEGKMKLMAEIDNQDFNSKNKSDTKFLTTEVTNLKK